MRLGNFAFRRVLFITALVALSGGAARALAPGEPYPVPAARPDPHYEAYQRSYTIPWTRPLDFNKLGSLHIRASLNGGPPTGFQVDTGSVGVIVGADEVPNLDPKAPPGSILYTSSGIELKGVWTTTTITFPDSTDGHGHQAAAEVPVLAVSEMVVHPGAVNSTAQPAQPSRKPHPHMFGIGFGRGLEPHPERNPWLNLTEMRAGTMRRGYTLTRKGITLGLTAGDVGSGYLFQSLEERTVSAEIAAARPGLKDWRTAPGSITVGGTAEPSAAVLLDTGLTNMMIGKPGLAKTEDVADGTEITVHLMGDRLHYTFTAGDKTDPVSPRRVTWVRAAANPTLNTGLRALAIFDYLYDADGGFLGLRPTAKHR